MVRSFKDDVLGVVAPAGSVAVSVNDRNVFSVATKTANYTILSTDHTIRVDATGGAVTITLPDAGTVSGRVFCVKKVDLTSNAVNIATTSAQTIDDETGVAVYLKGTSITVQSNGTNWDIL
jgi:hypothetical protein